MIEVRGRSRSRRASRPAAGIARAHGRAKSALLPATASLALLIFSCASPPEPFPEPPEPAPAPLAPAAPAVESEPLLAPVFRITSIHIGRDILVTTGLRIEIEAENPNSVPLELGSLTYRFSGEGRPWTSGESAGPFALAPGAVTRLSVDGTMNFADMDRKLFDLVASLKTVRYRLTGTALVRGGAETFGSDFDLEGSCAVER